MAKRGRFVKIGEVLDFYYWLEYKTDIATL